MTRKEKDLLLKDLCARLPYGIKGNFLNSDGSLSHDPLLRKVTITYSCLVTADGNEGMVLNGDLKPYLFPMSSMTKAQKKKYYSLADDVTIKPGENCHFGIKIHCIKLGISDNPHEGLWDDVDVDALDWLHKNHFDYRGLIEKGLAIDATGKNIY